MVSTTCNNWNGDPIKMALVVFFSPFLLLLLLLLILFNQSEKVMKRKHFIKSMKVERTRSCSDPRSRIKVHNRAGNKYNFPERNLERVQPTLLATNGLNHVWHHFSPSSSSSFFARFFHPHFFPDSILWLSRFNNSKATRLVVSIDLE